MPPLTWMFNTAAVIVAKHTRKYILNIIAGVAQRALYTCSATLRPLSATLYPSAGPLSDLTTCIKHWGGDLMLS